MCIKPHVLQWFRETFSWLLILLLYLCLPHFDCIITYFLPNICLMFLDLFCLIRTHMTSFGTTSRTKFLRSLSESYPYLNRAVFAISHLGSYLIFVIKITFLRFQDQELNIHLNNKNSCILSFILHFVFSLNLIGW